MLWLGTPIDSSAAPKSSHLPAFWLKKAAAIIPNSFPK